MYMKVHEGIQDYMNTRVIKPNMSPEVLPQSKGPDLN